MAVAVPRLVPLPLVPAARVLCASWQLEETVNLNATQSNVQWSR